MKIDVEEKRNRFLKAADSCLPAKDWDLLLALNQFTADRISKAAREATAAKKGARNDTDIQELQAHLHAFLTECWDALDGLARETNLCMYCRHPEMELYPPHRMTPQCGVYMVRKILHGSPLMRGHPVSQILWERTRPDPAYRRLSFLYNLSAFAPLPLPDDGKRLPGTSDVPQTLTCLLKDQPIEGCPLREGLNEIEEWLAGLVGTMYELLSDVVQEGCEGEGNDAPGTPATR